MLHRIQKLICAILAVMLVITMTSPAFAKGVKATVKNTSARFYTRANTASASVNLKKGTALTVTAVKNGWAKVSCKGVTGYMKTSALTKASKKVSAASWKSKVVKMDWFNGGSKVLKKGKYGYIYDVKTGILIKIKRMGGKNHADVEPATKADTAKLKSLGHGYSWDSRAVILISGGKYVAAAINTQPHGDQTIKNNGYDGQFCLHMVNSKTHGSGKINEKHQSAIKKAYNWAH